MTPGRFSLRTDPAVASNPVPGDHEALAAVEAATICASDAKMVRLGGAYPVFAGRDLQHDPICLGHEIALRLTTPTAEGGPFASGTRMGIQPDIYTEGRRLCLGVNIQGGFADTVLVTREMMESDLGAMVFQVPDRLGRAATAMLEPLACVEGAFRLWGRDSLKPGGRLAVICAEARTAWDLDTEAQPASVLLAGLSREDFARIAPGMKASAVEVHEDATTLADGPVDDLIVPGDVETASLGAVFDRLTTAATVTWLSPGPVAATAQVDPAHFHYGRLTLRGGRETRLSTVLERPIRTDYKPGGAILIYGAPGAMGRFHLMRAIEAPNGPSTITALARRRGKLADLVEELRPIAERHGCKLEMIATEDENRLDNRIVDVGYEIIIRRSA